MTESQPTTGPLRLTLELVPGSDAALLRVMSVLHRRRCRVTGVVYTGSAAGDRLQLLIDPPRDRADRVPRWLDALIEVRSVDTGGSLGLAERQPEPTTSLAL